MPLDEAQLTHRIAGRLRIKLRSRRRDAAYFSDLSRRLAQCDGVTDVHASPLTGSILIRHTTTVDAIATYADRHGLFSLRPPRVSSEESAPARAHAVMRREPAIARRKPGESHEERERAQARRLSATLAGLGTLQTVRGQIMAPAVTLFWYAYDAWRARPRARTDSPAPLPPVPVPPAAGDDADPNRR
ncbi:hypothetical protein B0G57_102424 [Trinickia symbiotica]|uniref:Uncharacterized protein n=1 Tax=Trinickia symbiotica TaxID=863227 RepID=A0A2N7XAJ5_9BURK|nr:hypothetical protein [Trinickia symbiotica]PMS38789.1 hypothetical protein C0Z20_02815 [Trinickia symbiotica]PPK46829.1 hypothetical protein B0G57_102424 [Trinickia symbiotica]